MGEFDDWTRDKLIHEIKQVRIQRDWYKFVARYKPVKRAKKFAWLHYRRVAEVNPYVDIAQVAVDIRHELEKRRKELQVKKLPSVKTIRNWIVEVPKKKRRGKPN